MIWNISIWFITIILLIVTLIKIKKTLYDPPTSHSYLILFTIILIALSIATPISSHLLTKKINDLIAFKEIHNWSDFSEWKNIKDPKVLSEFYNIYKTYIHYDVLLISCSIWLSTGIVILITFINEDDLYKKNRNELLFLIFAIPIFLVLYFIGFKKAFEWIAKALGHVATIVGIIASIFAIKVSLKTLSKKDQ